MLISNEITLIDLEGEENIIDFENNSIEPINSWIPNILESLNINDESIDYQIRKLSHMRYILEKKYTNKSKFNIETNKFNVAFSFPSEKRIEIEEILKHLKNNLDEHEIFYDKDYTAYLSRPNLDLLLTKVYRNNSKLLVIFLCEEYQKKDWCQLEFRAVRDIIKNREDSKIMYMAFDNTPIDGVLSIDNPIWVNEYSPFELSKFIMQRIDSII